MSIHTKAIAACISLARMGDGRISRAATAIRWCRAHRVIADAIDRAMHERWPSGLDFRRNTFCSSGRSLTWFLPNFLRAAAMIRDLRAEGYTVADARRIAMSAANCERCIWAVADAPPASVRGAAKGESKYGDGHMDHWAAETAAGLGVTVEHVWRWQVWRERARQAAKVGRRTRQWMAVMEHDLDAAKRVAASKHEAWEREHLAALPERLRTLQQTARCTCLIVHADGTGVTERLHDVGGTMTSIVGCNGYTLPVSLADMQRSHDEVYHPECGK